MRIALDAMGGDKAPAAPVEGALHALERHADVEVLLVGDPEVVARELAARGGPRPRIEIVASEGFLAMDDEPVRAMKAKPNNSAKVAAECLGSGRADGVVNLGSTGGAVAAATLFCRRLEGVKRPGIAVPFPRPSGVTVVIDAGTNVDARPEHLHQYAVMARHYARVAFGVREPRVGILSVGEEEHKGNRLVKEAWDLFRRYPVPGFVGNVEGRDLFGDVVDVVVCDGFVGNVVLKASEGLGEMMLGMAVAGAGGRPEGLALVKEMKRKFDYAEYGGVPLLGIRGAYVIGHGRSDARAVSNAIRVARDYVAADLDGRIAQDLAAATAAGA
jgi:glycerol-3-phosphate acyltransferase PlsX